VVGHLPTPAEVSLEKMQQEVPMVGRLLEGDELLEAITCNKHIEQAVQYPEYEVSLRPLESLSRVLAKDAPRGKYQRRKKHFKSVVHWGQRKLLLSEIEFLTLFAQPGDTVVYAGAAPGIHIYPLTLLFPFLKFVLIDPRPVALVENERITIRQEMMTDEIAGEFEEVGRRGNLLFICDVRTRICREYTFEQSEAIIQKDMDDQQRWHLLMHPRKSMLKFRLPWTPGYTEYLDGEVYLPVWGRCTTTEARLVVGGNSKRQWDNCAYEDQMFYFNISTRTQLYHHEHHVSGLDWCFDCASEVIIWKSYFGKFGGVWDYAACKLSVVFSSRKLLSPKCEDSGDEDDDGEAPTVYLGEYEAMLMSVNDPWESEVWMRDSKFSDTNAVREAVVLANSICSRRRTLVSPLRY
jgi:hypothetical protein